MKNINLLFLFLFSISFSSFSQTLEEKFDEMLNNEYKASEPGATALVAKDGEIIYHKAFGMANLELDVPMKTDMVFKIASISKQFTAVAILMLVEDGKIKLEDDITKYIEDYPTHDKHISIKHLLTHSSGISRSITQNPWNANVRKSEFELKSFIDYFKDEPMAFSPGEIHRYNNFNYIILAYIIEQVSGQSYEDYIESNIFEELGMANSRQWNDADIVKNRAYGYENRDGFVNKEYVNYTQAIGAGSLMSTVEDLFIWNRALKSNRLISQESLGLAFTNHQLEDGSKMNYGFGFFINEIKGSPTVEHAGGLHGFMSNGIYLPDEDVFVAVFTNCSCKDPRTISTKMAAITIDKPYESPTFVSTNSNELQKWVGRYTFKDGSSRSVYLNDEQLYWILPNGTEWKMIPLSKSSFQLENTFSQIDFKLLGDTAVQLSTKSRISEKTASKKYHKHEEIPLVESEVQKYLGEYKLFPEFSLTISLEDGQLKSRGTDQKAINMYPESSTRFFFKSLDSWIDFKLDEDGNCTSLELTQDGKVYAGKKVD